jgi:hypothetical protein
MVYCLFGAKERWCKWNAAAWPSFLTTLSGVEAYCRENGAKDRGFRWDAAAWPSFLTTLSGVEAYSAYHQ